MSRRARSRAEVFSAKRVCLVPLDGSDIDDDDGPDEPVCERCRGDGTDPMCDHLLPCPVCQGEQSI